MSKPSMSCREPRPILERLDNWIFCHTVRHGKPPKHLLIHPDDVPLLKVETRALCKLLEGKIVSKATEYRGIPIRVMSFTYRELIKKAASNHHKLSTQQLIANMA